MSDTPYTTGTMSPGGRPSHTKIVATLGPASESSAMVEALLQAGVDVFRINTAHGNRQEHQQRLDTVRQASKKLSQPVAVLVDLAGPKIRLGKLPDDRLDCLADAELTFVRGEKTTQPAEVTTSYERLIDELSPGDRIMLADGTVSLVVQETGEDFARCRVVQPGTIGTRQGVNLPGVRLSVPALTPADLDAAAWAAQAGVDLVGLSFVRSPEDVRQLKSLLAEHDSSAQVIAKIEKPEAVDRLEEIVAAADGIMVARGDLGVEIDIAEVAVVQKRIVTMCSRHRKPVIIATQMLDSMQRSRLPTRAEVTDVANAILDGADACMLSGETAIGKHPVEAVSMMHRIAMATEPLYRNRRRRPLDLESDDDPLIDLITETTVLAGGRMARRLDARLVVVGTATGQTALSLSKHRNSVPTVGVSDSEATLRRMCLYWGVLPMSGAPTGDVSQLITHVTRWGRATGLLSVGDRIVLITGSDLLAKTQNTIVVHEVPED